MTAETSRVVSGGAASPGVQGAKSRTWAVVEFDEKRITQPLGIVFPSMSSMGESHTPPSQSSLCDRTITSRETDSLGGVNAARIIADQRD